MCFLLSAPVYFNFPLITTPSKNRAVWYHIFRSDRHELKRIYFPSGGEKPEGMKSQPVEARHIIRHLGINLIYFFQKVVFCDSQDLSAKRSTQDSYFLIAEKSIPNINMSSMENLFILLIVTDNNANISSQFVSITKQSFAEKLFILLKKVSTLSKLLKTRNVHR